LVEQTLPDEDAAAEALRCMQCSQVCDKCVEVCPNRSNVTYLTHPLAIKVPRLTCSDGGVEVVGHDTFAVGQARQILHVTDSCNECGNCDTFCVHQGRPFADKPRLFLNHGDFELADDNAFLVHKDAGGWTIRRREGGVESSVTLGQDGSGMAFENQHVYLRVGPDAEMTSMTLKEPFEGEISLRPAAEMVVILEGVLSAAPFLVV
jgi:putative selenate reductase